MKLKLHNRARSRIALAGLLAVVAGSTFAQTDTAKPGTVASAQAKSKGASSAAKPASGAKPAKPTAKGGAQDAAAPAGPSAPMQPDGRLKPHIIRPEAPPTDPAAMQGMNPPGMHYQNGPQMRNQNPQMGNPAMGMQAPVTAPASKNPFAPAPAPSAVPATPQPITPMQPAGPMPGGTPPAGTAAAGKKDEVKAPSINLECTTPEIKNHGVFVGKIQNRYVYKYKDQYCFDIEP